MTWLRREAGRHRLKRSALECSHALDVVRLREHVNRRVVVRGADEPDPHAVDADDVAVLDAGSGLPSGPAMLAAKTGTSPPPCA